MASADKGRSYQSFNREEATPQRTEAVEGPPIRAVQLAPYIPDKVRGIMRGPVHTSADRRAQLNCDF